MVFPSHNQIENKLFEFYLGVGRCFRIFTGVNKNECGNWCFKICSEKKWLLRGVNLDGDLFFKYSNFVWVQHLLHWNTLNSCNQLFWTMEGVALECTTQINAEVLGWNHVPWFSFPVCLFVCFFPLHTLFLKAAVLWSVLRE